MELYIENFLSDFTSAIVLAILTGVYSLIRGKHEYLVASKNLGKNIDGQWFSAELDFKQKALGNAFVKVDIQRKKWGNQVIIKTLQQLNKDEVRHETSWIVKGKVLTDSTIISEFVGLEGQTAGYGNAFLRFIGNGRAVGYWVGYSSKYSGQPMYGYWILCQDEAELKDLAKFVLEHFQYFNVKYMVEHYDSKMSIKDYVIKA
mgnify:CR=1 FL=1|jgi:hypothetical protein